MLSGKLKNLTDVGGEAAYNLNRTVGPKKWYKSVKGFFTGKKGTDDSETSSTPSSGKDDDIEKRLLVRDRSSTTNYNDEDLKRRAKRTAHSIILMKRFLWGMTLVQSLHLILSFQSPFDPLEAAVVTGFFCFGVSVAMAFSRGARAVALLMLPSFCTSNGRSILITYALMMLMTGPANNIAYNYGEMSRSLTCGNELGFNMTHGLKRKIEDLQYQVLDEMDNTIDVILNAIEKVREFYDDMLEKLEAMTNMFDGINGFFKDLTLICGTDFTDYLCDLPGDIARHMKYMITAPFKTALKLIKRHFNVDIQFEHEFTFKANASKSSDDIKEAIKEEVEAKIGQVTDAMWWVRLASALSTVFVVLKAAMYRKKYLTKNDFDNYYISGQFKHLDRKHKRHGKPSVLPLRYKESKKFVSPKRCFMSRAELKKCFKGWGFVTLNMTYSLLVMLLDHALFSTMYIVKKTFTVKGTTFVDDAMAMMGQETDAYHAITFPKIIGNGLIPTIFRASIHSLEKITKKEGLDLNVDKCLPNPRLPDYHVFLSIFMILQGCYVMVYIEAYVLRLRRLIMANYYPGRERARILYLRRKILTKRGIGDVDNLKHTLRDASVKVDKHQKVRKMRFLWKWSNMRGIKGKIGRILTGRTAHSCVLCMFSGSSKDDALFVRCRRPGCALEYCVECFNDLHRICPSCLMRHGKEKKKIRRLSRILGIEPVDPGGDDPATTNLEEDFVPSSGISDSSAEEIDNKKYEDMTQAEIYADQLQRQADSRLATQEEP